MYKHTFYYFLGNKKYPEIYILPEEYLAIFGCTSYVDAVTVFLLQCVYVGLKGWLAVDSIAVSLTSWSQGDGNAI